VSSTGEGSEGLFLFVEQPTQYKKTDKQRNQPRTAFMI
jgi:hypothetical protein